ncbi:unnamed protein product [Meloidogyne enterolobii]|uniref:Uncharacterized protein n=1 Tax=Meloidogyne enterolobii TaxID=390850 RepID=A0ACB1ACQ0_MELEN
MAPRRESRSKESISGTAAPKQRKSVASTSAAVNSSTVRHSTTGGHRSSNFSSDLMFQSSSTSLLSNVLRALTVRILLMVSSEKLKIREKLKIEHKTRIKNQNLKIRI